MDGWIKLHRSIMDDPNYFAEPFNRVAAWVDLLLMANTKDTVVYVRGVRVEVKRGQLAISEVELAKRWNISRTKVRRYLQEWEIEQQIEQQKNNRTHSISIRNYNKYQCNRTAENTAEKQQPKEKKENSPLNPLYKNKKKTLTDVRDEERKEIKEKICKKRTATFVATNLEERKKAFYDSLIPYVERYGRNMVRNFYDYWSEENRSQTKMRFELEKTWEVGRRLGYWYRRSNNETTTNSRRGYGREQQRRDDMQYRMQGYAEVAAGFRKEAIADIEVRRPRQVQPDISPCEDV